MLTDRWAPVPCKYRINGRDGKTQQQCGRSGSVSLGGYCAQHWWRIQSFRALQKRRALASAKKTGVSRL